MSNNVQQWTSCFHLNPTERLHKSFRLTNHQQAGKSSYPSSRRGYPAYAWQIGPFWQDTLDVRMCVIMTHMSMVASWHGQQWICVKRVGQCGALLVLVNSLNRLLNKQTICWWLVIGDACRSIDVTAMHLLWYRARFRSTCPKPVSHLHVVRDARHNFTFSQVIRILWMKLIENCICVHLKRRLKNVDRFDVADKLPLLLTCKNHGL